MSTNVVLTTALLLTYWIDKGPPHEGCIHYYLITIRGILYHPLFSEEKKWFFLKTHWLCLCPQVLLSVHCPWFTQWFKVRSGISKHNFWEKIWSKNTLKNIAKNILIVPERISQNIMKIITAAYILGSVQRCFHKSSFKSSRVQLHVDEIHTRQKVILLDITKLWKSVLIKSVFYFTKLKYVATRFATYTLLFNLLWEVSCWSMLWRFHVVATHWCFWHSNDDQYSSHCFFAWAFAS